MKRQIASSRCLITGASSGIGRALAKQLVLRGGDVIATTRRQDKLQSLQAEVANAEAGKCYIMAGDLTDRDFRQALVDSTHQRFGGLDLLISNAGAGAIGRFENADAERLAKILSLNVVAPIELIRGLLPTLSIGKQPAIVNIGSVLAHCSVPWKSEYCAAKSAMQGFSDSLRAELTQQGISVLVVNPSTTASEFFDQVLDSPDSAKGLKRAAMSPERVAEHIIRSIQKNRSEINLSFGGKSLVFLARHFPSVTRLVMAKWANKGAP